MVVFIRPPYDESKTLKTFVNSLLPQLHYYDEINFRDFHFLLLSCPRSTFFDGDKTSFFSILKFPRQIRYREFLPPESVNAI